MGEHFLNLDIGLPVDQLRPMIRRTLAGELGPHEIAVPAVNRRGRTISVRILGTPLHDPAGAAATGVILLMDGDVATTRDVAGEDVTGRAPARGNGRAPVSGQR